MFQFIKKWGVSEEEISSPFPSDPLEETYDDIYYRGIDIYSSPENIFLWLCQMRVAPYSYDWIDNLGRKSPQIIIEGLDRLKIDQKMMFIFNIKSFQKNSYITIHSSSFMSKYICESLLCYKIEKKQGGKCRLLVKMCVKFPFKWQAYLFNTPLAFGDLIMMRKQLLNFKRLSERDKIS